MISGSISNYYSPTTCKNLLFLQGYLESTVSKCTCLCFDFGDFSGKKKLKRNNKLGKSLLQGLASGQGSVMIVGLLVNTGA